VVECRLSYSFQLHRISSLTLRGHLLSKSFIRNRTRRLYLLEMFGSFLGSVARNDYEELEAAVNLHIGRLLFFEHRSGIGVRFVLS